MVRSCLLLLLMSLLTIFAQPAPATEFYVDPVHGNADNDGSAARPWQSLQAVFDKGLVESRQWEKLPYRDGAKLVPKNAGAPVRPGDTIYLRSGDYGNLEIRGYYNADWITIAAQEGHEARFTRILIRSGGHWKLQGVSVSPAAGAEKAGAMIDLESHGFHGPIHDTVVE
ncbi:MAG: hypothetical protein ACYC6Y_23590, partial [Thermoguttaceae bacterium]